MHRPKRVLIAICLCALGVFNAHACGKTSVMSATEADGSTVELVLDPAVIAQTPAWTPGAGDPPLSVARAHKIATKWAARKYQRFDSVEIREITLTALGCTSNRDHWYYIFEFTPTMNGNRMYGSGNWAAVLMDGTVIEATRKSVGEPGG